MTRKETLETMIKKANELKKNYTRPAEDEIWRISATYNATHEDEIAMFEHENEETGTVDGFYIEDELWTFEQ